MSQKPLISVIIPTFNRAVILDQTMTALCQQTYPQSKTEIIIIDDGSRDNTKQIVKKYQQKKTIKIIFLSQIHKGPAVARNLGIKHARGRILLFINDDMVPSAHLVKEHVNWHQHYSAVNYAVLGQAKWHQSYLTNPFMRWLVVNGPQFNYGQIKGIKAQWYQAWTANISYKRQFLWPDNLFDQDFKHAAWEDIELAYRLNKQGLQLRYNAKALCYHHHDMTISGVVPKMRQNGAGAVILGQKISEYQLLPPLARPTMGKICDLIDQWLVPAWLGQKWDQWMNQLASKLNWGWLFNIYLLHYRIQGRRQYLQWGKV